MELVVKKHEAFGNGMDHVPHPKPIGPELLDDGVDMRSVGEFDVATESVDEQRLHHVTGEVFLVGKQGVLELLKTSPHTVC